MKKIRILIISLFLMLYLTPAFAGVYNGGFEFWSSGLTSDADGWTSSGGATLRAESNIKVSGSYSAKAQSWGSYGSIYQYDIHESEGIGYWQNNIVKYEFWAYCPSTNDKTQYVRFSDGVTTDSSTAFFKDDIWHFYSFTKEIDEEATDLSLRFYINNVSTWDGNDILYLDDVSVEVVPEPVTMVLLGSLATGLFGMAGVRKRFSRK